MILDSYTTFAEDQALTASADGTNVIDIGANGIATYPLYVVFTVSTALTQATAFEVMGCDTEDGTYSVVVQTGSLSTDDLVAGAHIAIPLPPQCPEFLKVHFEMAAAGTGTVSAFLAFNPQTNREDTMTEAN